MYIIYVILNWRGDSREIGIDLVFEFLLDIREKYVFWPKFQFDQGQVRPIPDSIKVGHVRSAGNIMSIRF